MKASTILKTFLVIAVIAIIGYIVYNSNKAAEINSLVNSTTKPYDFEAHVDSACAQISASEFKEAKLLYDKIYQEMDVYSGIVVDGASYIDIEEQNSLFEKSFDAYFPTLERAADTLFGSRNWTPTKDNLLKKEVEKLTDNSSYGKRGMSRTAKKKLGDYKSYFQGYYKLGNLIKNLASCQDSATYMTYEKLDNYKDYPYNKLADLQQERAKARSNAKNHWEKALEDEAKEIMNDTIIDSFDSRQQIWRKKVKSYENTIHDEDHFKKLKGDLQRQFEQLVKEANND